MPWRWRIAGTVLLALSPVAAPPGAATAAPPTLDVPGPLLGDLDAAERDGLAPSLGREAPGSPDSSETSVAVLVRAADGVEVLSVPVRDGHGERVAELLEDQPSVVAADVDVPVRLLAADPERGRQWSLDRLGADELARHPALHARRSPVVAVLDTGVQAEHPDLRGRVIAGYDVLEGRPLLAGAATDPHGHGTHVAGVIGAVTGNGLGIASMVADARLMPVRVLDASGSSTAARVAEGILWAVDAGAEVVNLSLGGPTGNSVLQAAVQHAESRGVVVVAAAGNSGASDNSAEYPSAYPTVLAVAATDGQDARSAFSTYGPQVDIAAPGELIYATDTGSRYTWRSGTSTAAPHVAATAALVLAADPWLTPAQVRARLAGTAEDLGVRGRDPEFGAGLVDPYAAVRPAAVQAGSGVRGDWTGDGRVDVLAVRRDGTLWCYAVAADGRLGAGRQVGPGWSAMTWVGSPGDLDGDRHTDLLARRRDGALMLYAGRGNGRFWPPRQVGQGWQSMTAIVTAGDVDGDGHRDLLARRNDGTLHSYRFSSTGSLSGRGQVGTGWNGMRAILGVGDTSGDGRGDVLAVRHDGALFAYRGTAAGLRGAGQVGRGWSSMSLLSSPGDLVGGGADDVLARRSDGTLWLYQVGSAGLRSRGQVGRGWGGMTTIV